jgi:hypothetical protein
VTGVTRKGVRRWIVLLTLIFVVALVLALLVLTLYQPSERPADTGAGAAPANLPASLAEGVTARQAYPPAAEIAQSWQPDGQLAIVTAHWRPRQGRWSTDVAWTFQFYSPTTRQLAVVVVDGGRARLLREALSPYPLRTFGTDDWQLDSLAALGSWWNAGGGTFVSLYSEVDLTAQLRVLDGDGADGRLVWTVTGITGGQLKRLVVDGTTGEQVQD